MALQTVYDIEIGDKEYKIEMTNMALYEFEIMVDMAYMDWMKSYAFDENMDLSWRPSYGDFLKLIICMLKEHQRKLKFNPQILSKYVSPKDIKKEFGITVLNCLLASLIEPSDLEDAKDDLPEATEDDPLDESQSTGMS